MDGESRSARGASRVITIEEHFTTPAFLEGPGRQFKERAQTARLMDQLCDLGDRRIADMDSAGIDLQVLSLVSPGVNQLDADEAINLARQTNEILGRKGDSLNCAIFLGLR